MDDGNEPTSEADTQQQQVPPQGVSTSTPILGSGTTGGSGSGSQVAITNTSASGLPASTMSLQQDAISGILKSGLLSDPLQVAALQEKLAALAVGSGGISVPMPPINVTQVPLFKTATDSAMFQMNALLQNLPQLSNAPGTVTNMDGVFAIMRQIASEQEGA